jgi:hypothetical protein
MKDEEDKDGKDYLPTPDEIRIACDNIQKSWSNHRKKSRLTVEQDELSITVIDTSSLSYQLRNISE